MPHNYVPSEEQFEEIKQGWKGVRKNKAAGPDGLIKELYEAMPEDKKELLDHFSAWQLEQGCFTIECLGACLKTVPKAGKCRNTPKGWRGVQALQHTTKAELNVVAEKAGGPMQEATGSKQFGGKTGCSTATPIAEFEWTAAHAEAAGVSMASVATDIVGAFDETIKELVLGLSEGDSYEGMQRRLGEAKVPKEAIDHVIEELQHKGSLLQRAGVDEHS